MSNLNNLNDEFTPEPSKFGRFREIESCYKLLCRSELSINNLAIRESPSIKYPETGTSKLDVISPKIIELKKDYSALATWLKSDIIKSKYKCITEIGELLKICRKYKCRLCLSSQLIVDGQDSGGVFVNKNTFDQTPIENYYGENLIFLSIYESFSVSDFVKNLRHEVLHLLQFEYNLGKIGIDIYDEMALYVFDNPLYRENSAEELICEFESHTADKVPFMVTHLEKDLLNFSHIKDSVYAATSNRIRTINKIAVEAKIPIYNDELSPFNDPFVPHNNEMINTKPQSWLYETKEEEEEEEYKSKILEIEIEKDLKFIKSELKSGFKKHFLDMWYIYVLIYLILFICLYFFGD